MTKNHETGGMTGGPPPTKEQRLAMFKDKGEMLDFIDEKHEEIQELEKHKEKLQNEWVAYRRRKEKSIDKANHRNKELEKQLDEMTAEAKVQLVARKKLMTDLKKAEKWKDVVGDIHDVLRDREVESDNQTTNEVKGFFKGYYRLDKALVEISKGEGRFSTDQLTHANNTIEDMKALAVAALNNPVRSCSTCGCDTDNDGDCGPYGLSCKDGSKWKPKEGK